MSNTQEAFKQLSAEVSRLAKMGTNRFSFIMRPGKSIILVSTSSTPPISVMVRTYNQFTLAYHTQIPCDSPALDYHVEVLEDQNGYMHLREGHKLLTPQQLAAKLVALVAAEDPETESASC